jgi:hypothetical protein
MRHSLTLRIGPATFRIGSAWAQPIDQLARLYADYPDVGGAIADFTVRLQPTSAVRRWVRPSIFITGDHGLADVQVNVPGVGIAYTNHSGMYWLDVPTGNFDVEVSPMPDWAATTPTLRTASLLNNAWQRRRYYLM